MAMTEPKPLFPDEDIVPLPGQTGGGQGRVTVKPLEFRDEPDGTLGPAKPAGFAIALPDDLGGTPSVLAKPAPVNIRPAIAGTEHPFVAVALTRGERLFPELLQDSGFLIRNLLSDIIPVDFDKLAVFGTDTLQRVAFLAGQVEELNGAFHRIDAEGVINGITQRAKDHAASRHRSVAGLLAGLIPFDESLARSQIEVVHDALKQYRQDMRQVEEDIGRLTRTLAIETAVLAILDDMGDHGSMGDLLSSRLTLLVAAKRELEIAGKQMASLCLLAEQWLMRGDELASVILSALGLVGRR